MTNINCNENCIYQKDGKCDLDSIGPIMLYGFESDCAYFMPKDKKTQNQNWQLQG